MCLQEVGKFCNPLETDNSNFLNARYSTSLKNKDFDALVMVFMLSSSFLSYIKEVCSHGYFVMLQCIQFCFEYSRIHLTKDSWMLQNHMIQHLNYSIFYPQISTFQEFVAYYTSTCDQLLLFYKNKMTTWGK